MGDEWDDDVVSKNLFAQILNNIFVMFIVQIVFLNFSVLFAFVNTAG